ncbi:MAG: phosphatase PAP2 family protein [Lachnospiraceae bacterium]|nr:phosphatase PAP2 family protein [Lachnospiraceae bacterium]
MFLTEVPYNSFFFDWEISLEEWLQAALPDGVITAISQFSFLGETTIMLVIMGILYWGLDKEFGKYVGVNILVAITFNPLIKNIFIRRRPYFESEGIDLKRLIEPKADKYDMLAQGYSFPSGHSSGSLTLYGSLACYMKKRWMTVLAIVFPILVGFSRVVVGAHYPTDVFVGWIMGIAIIFLVPLLREKAPSDIVFNIILAVVFAVGFFYCTSDDYFSSYGMLLGFVFADPFEQKFVNFENTKNPIRVILRVIGGLGLYEVLNPILKMPFSDEFLNSGTFAAHGVRSLRYAVIIFVIIGIYPMLFKVTDKLFKKEIA